MQWQRWNDHIISECSKLAQKEYKTRHDWVDKIICREMCKKFESDHTNKWYMHNPASVLKTDTHKLLWDLDIHRDHLISTRRPNIIIINKKGVFVKMSTLLIRKWSWKNVKRRISTSTLIENWKKLWNMKVTIIPIVIGAFGTNHNLRTSGDHPNDSITEDSQNTEKSLRDSRLAITKTPVKYHQLKLMWKTLKE